VTVDGWGSDVQAFRNATGITFEVVGNPGLPVSTSRIPVTALYNKVNGVTQVTTVGVVSYSSLVSKVTAGVTGQTVTTATGGS
jgi:hypothetical protein